MIGLCLEASSLLVHLPYNTAGYNDIPD